MPIYSCRINGKPTQLNSWDPRQPLLYALRAHGLTGAKIGCGLGQCGSCTVLVNNDAIRSCVVSIESVAGKNVVTIEGLGSEKKPDPVQAAFVEEQAAQCGYCTPGMILSTKALLARRPKPSVAQIREALSGNLCRCGAHLRIVRAVLRASGQVK